MSEENNNKPSYDFEFITQSLGLIPYRALGADDVTVFSGAFNPGAIINLEIAENHNVAITLHGGEEILMTSDHMAELETAFRNQIEQQKLRQAEAFEQHKLQQAELAKTQIRAQAEAVAELQQGVQPGVIVGAPTKKGWRH